MLYIFYVYLWLTEEKSTNMNCFELTGSLERDDDLEILEEPPVKIVVLMAPRIKVRKSAWCLAKKGRGGTPGAEKLVPNAERIRASKRLARAETTVSRKRDKKDR